MPAVKQKPKPKPRTAPQNRPLPASRSTKSSA
jgi:hypothetical protein